MSAAIALIEDLPGIPPERSFYACTERHHVLAVLVPFSMALPWDASAAQLLALFRVNNEGGWASLSVLADTAGHRAVLLTQADDAALCRWLAANGIGWFDAASPVSLEPVHIPKPWGEEIWFTGIEPRGVSCAVPVSGQAVPLTWLLSAIPEYLLGNHAGHWPVLLKILSPLPDAGFGDLYLELHEEKREVYIITGVDRAAWPDGVGKIRLGVNPAAVAEHGDEQHFRDAFATAARAYEAHRREVDAWLDQRRMSDGLPANEPVSPAWLRSQLAAQPMAWHEREESLRETLESFTSLKSLQVGDVVQVPLRVPHSLQHGVRAVEFQTPVYERKILAFGQKVLTQPHWDSREGADLMSLSASTEPVLPVLEQAPGLQVEQVARFDDFSVQRVSVKAGHVRVGEAGSYRIVMGLSGGLSAGIARLGPEQAWFWPAALSLRMEVAQRAENTVFLEAIPA